MFNVLTALPDKLKNETVLGIASAPIFAVLASLFEEACKVLVPDITQEQAINLCVPEYHKKLLLDIKKIAPSALASKPPIYELLLTGVHSATLHIAVHFGPDTPVRPEQAGPAVTCDFELYDKLQKDIRVWFEFSRQISMAYWALMFFNQTNGHGALGELYTVEEFRYMFHGLQPIISRAIKIQEHDVAFYAKLVSQAYPGKKQQAISVHSYELAKLNTLKVLQKKFSSNRTRYPAYATHSMRNEISNINQSIAQALIFSEAKIEKPPNLYTCITEDSFHPFFAPQPCEMVGLNPWNMGI